MTTIEFKKKGLTYRARITGEPQKITLDLQTLDYSRRCREDWMRWQKQIDGSSQAEIFKQLYLDESVSPLYVKLATTAFDLAEGEV